MHDHVHNNRIGCLFFSSGSICKQKNQQGPCITPRDTAGKKIILTTVKKVEIRQERWKLHRNNTENIC